MESRDWSSDVCSSDLYGAILLGLVVLRTKAQNGFCPMCTKGCYTVLTHSNPFWGQFWGQICKTNSDLRRSNKCAALVPLRKVDTHITGFTQVKAQRTGDEILLSSKKLYASQLYTIPAHRPCHREKRPCLGAFTPRRSGALPAKYCPKFPVFRGFFILPQRHLPERDFPVQVNPAQINN